MPPNKIKRLNLDSMKDGKYLSTERKKIPNISTDTKSFGGFKGKMTITSPNQTIKGTFMIA